MIVLNVDPKRPEPEAIRAAAEAIRAGDLVVFPTETVYGLAADALNPEAVRRVFAAKGRSGEQALPIQVAGADELSKVAVRVPESARKLAEAFWPGPLTLVVPKSDAVPDLVTGGKPAVGVRVPDHPVALALLRQLGSPTIATSANRAGKAPAASAADAVAGIEEAVAIVLDAGTCRIGVPSTVVDVTVDPPRVLREGAIGADRISQVLGDIGTGER